MVRWTKKCGPGSTQSGRLKRIEWMGLLSFFPRRFRGSFFQGGTLGQLAPYGKEPWQYACIKTITSKSNQTGFCPPRFCRFSRRRAAFMPKSCGKPNIPSVGGTSVGTGIYAPGADQKCQGQLSKPFIVNLRDMGFQHLCVHDPSLETPSASSKRQSIVKH